MTDTASNGSRLDASPVRVLIVAAHYPPVNSVAATRPAQWARLLSQRGCVVSVLTTAIREGSLQGYDLTVPPGELIRVAVPGSRLIARLDSPFAEPGSGRGERSQHRPGMIARLTNWLRRSRGVFTSARMPDHHDLWMLAALWRIRGRRWDVVISTHGPYACHLVGYYLRRCGRARRWISDYRDLWVDNHIYPGLFPFTSLERYLEAVFCHNADVITTVSDGLAARLASRHGRQVEVIHNTIDLDMWRHLDATPAFPADECVRLVYTGTVYPVGQNPEILFRALVLVRSRAPTEFARLRMVFAGKSQSSIRELASHYGMTDILDQPGQVSRDLALRMQRDAGVLIFFNFCADGHAGILTSKLFEYLVSGTRILSMGAKKDPSTAAMLARSERGLDFGDDVSELAKEIERLVSHSATEEKYVLASTREFVDSERCGDALYRLLGEHPDSLLRPDRMVRS